MFSIIGLIILLSAVVWLTLDLLEVRFRAHNVWIRRAVLVAVFPFASICTLGLSVWAVYRDREWGSFMWELRDFYDSLVTAWAKEIN